MNIVAYSFAAKIQQHVVATVLAFVEMSLQSVVAQQNLWQHALTVFAYEEKQYAKGDTQ